MALSPQHLNLISLCTGGGGLDLGVELAIPDARSVVLVEGEAWSVATLVSAMESGLMAPAPVWSDVRTFDGRPWRGIVDGLIGGIPCQPHSLAGKRLGEDDERDLWSPARRIIVQSRPWFVLIENVRGMLSAAEGLEPGAFRVYGETYNELVTRLSSESLQRRKLARATKGSASLSSPWRTPSVSNSERGAQDANERQAQGHTVNLQDQVKAWGTPTARDWKDGSADLTNVPENGLLGRMAANWSTPRASDGEKGGPNQSFGAGGMPLPAMAQQWMTPRVTVGKYTRDGGDRSAERLTMEGQALAFILPDHPISTVGEESSKIRRTLNPLFVEWLMGWPPGWTSLALTPPASNGCACSATALSLYKQRMRSALWQLGLPEDQPVQQRLFA